MSTSLTARLFGSGIPATGEAATLEVIGDDIQVLSGKRKVGCSIAELSLREVGFGREIGYELAWRDGKAFYAAHVLDAKAIQTLRSSALADSPQMRRLTRSTRKRAAGRTAGWLLIVAILAFPLLLILVLILQADRLAQVITDRIPITQEVRLGEAAFQSLRPSLELQEEGAAHDAVQAIGSRLSGTSSYAYRFHVANNDAINAFALPGGIIVVHTGLIEATRRPEELAGVLAHEIQHVEQRHSLQAAVKELGLRAVWMWVTGDVGGALTGQAALELTLRRFSRDVERSADAGAVDMLVRGGIDPQGMVDFFSTMSERRSEKVPEFLSTHPSDRDRQRALREQITGLQAESFVPLQWERWPPSD